MKLQHALCSIFLFLVGALSIVNSQSFSVRSDRIEYICPDTHELITITEDLESVKSIHLSRVDNYFAIHFPEKDSVTGQTLDYFFKLYTSKVPDEWLSFEEELRLVGLEDGDYTLMIMARNDLGQQSQNIIELEMDVPPPYWRTWWFLLCMVLLVLGIVSLWRSYEYRILKIKKDRDLKISNLEAHAYRAQMNPHFIFNALNGMQAAMVLHGEEKFNKYISSFSKLIRNTFEMSNLDKISLDDELDYIENYIDLQALRLEKAIQTTIHIDDEIEPETSYLPCMMLQPIVENAIVHGLVKKDGENKIDIHFTKLPYFLRCRISDNGIGRTASAEESEKYNKTHKSFATQIMKQRIDIFNYYNNYELSFNIEDLYDDKGKPSGTAVTLMIPLDFKSREK